MAAPLSGALVSPLNRSSFLAGISLLRAELISPNSALCEGRLLLLRASDAGNHFDSSRQCHNDKDGEAGLLLEEQPLPGKSPALPPIAHGGDGPFYSITP